MKRITITIPDETLEEVQRAVSLGRAPNVSSFIAEAAAQYVRQDSLSDVLDQLDVELGKPTKNDFTWARRVLGR